MIQTFLRVKLKKALQITYWKDDAILLWTGLLQIAKILIIKTRLSII